MNFREGLKTNSAGSNYHQGRKVEDILNIPYGKSGRQERFGVYPKKIT